MATIERGDGRIDYAVHGAGAPLVILRGLGRSVRHWLGYERVLARHFQVITLDLRGVGATTAASRLTTSVFDMADDVVAVLDALSLPTAHILGVSLGGMVTLAMGLRHPERCRSLITVNTSIAGQGTSRITRGALRAMTAVVSRDRDLIHSRLVDVLVGTDVPSAQRPAIAREYAVIAREQGLFARTVVKQLVAAARFRVGEALPSMTVPTMVVYGTADRFVPNVNSRNLAARLPDAQLVAIEGGGHELTLDKGEELAAQVQRWVREVEGRPLKSARNPPNS